MNAKLKWVPVALVLIVGIVGCGSKEPAAQPSTTAAATTAPATTAPTPAPASTPKPAPTTPATLTRAQAATRYMAIIKPANAVFDEPKCKQSEDFFVNGGSWPPDDQPTWDERADRVLRACYKKMVPLYEQSLKAMQTTKWPADAKADMDDLISLDQAVLHCIKQGARATSSDAMFKALECTPPDDGSADRVRARFGLPGRNAS